MPHSHFRFQLQGNDIANGVPRCHRSLFSFSRTEAEKGGMTTTTVITGSSGWIPLSDQPFFFLPLFFFTSVTRQKRKTYAAKRDATCPFCLVYGLGRHTAVLSQTRSLKDREAKGLSVVCAQ
ncbi:hypothetical protein NPIL_88731 [Nephila pilipes]|uniref:Uncharacterized protein n=1 Tax=Nephila pilipes TaxID=299642 RepID=A0A8X6N504_NEPPI|nr:hypothetical protein NPIL_88731 [Nephila pilipes]